MINVQPVVSFVKYLQLIIFSAAILYFGKKLFIPLFFGLLIAIIIYSFAIGLKNRHGVKLLMATMLIQKFRKHDNKGNGRNYSPREYAVLALVKETVFPGSVFCVIAFICSLYFTAVS